MIIPDRETHFRLPGSDSPLKKSTSVTAIIHGGGEDKPNNLYYVDSLERFKRDHASIDKQERELRKQKQDNIRARKRMQSIERETNVKQTEDNNFSKLKNRQSQSQHLYKEGSKITINTNGTPIDPLTLRYQNTEKGKQMERFEKEKEVNNLVRAHKLQTYGTSGYNIINGQKNMTVEEMVSSDSYGTFHHKLSNYYQKFRIKPDDL